MLNRAWIPSALERKCLQHLDAPGSWKMLHAEPPEETDLLRWRPFRRIFGFNFLLFGVILTGLFFVLEASAGAAASEIREDLTVGLGIVALLAAGLGFYSMHLYRRSWNRRARSLRYQSSQFDDRPRGPQTPQHPQKAS